MRSRHHVGLAGRFLAAAAVPRVVLAALLALVATATAAQAQTVSITGCSVSTYRWTLEEDNTYAVTPGTINPDNETASVSFHKSYMRVVAQGNQGQSPWAHIDPAKAYFLSVLPSNGCTNGGARIAPGQTSVAIPVAPMPLPTAQISIFVSRWSSSWQMSGRAR